MTRKTTLLSVMTVLALGSTAIGVSSATAQGRGHMTPPPFSELDADGNGQITASDMEAFAAARFAAADTDGDGSLSADELTARAMERAQERSAAMSTRMMNRMDKDGDGTLSREELESGHGGKRGGDMGARMLERADTDGDGAVSEAEYTAAGERMAQRMGKHHERGGNGEGERKRHN